ncbi:MAG: macrocin O-methyltransferase [Flavobacteriales bacterium]|nr:MAG: macrocin O-methyltransferase [Flavobacteriales bacterium]
MKRILISIIKSLGYEVRKTKFGGVSDDIIENKEFMELYEFCKPYTMTTIEKMFALYMSVEYVLENNIEGDFVECGVWRGGSAMLIAKYLALKNIDNRNIFLYDTYEGMTEPTKVDINIMKNMAINQFEKTKLSEDSSDWCYAGIEDVENNLYSTGIKKECLHFIKGKVEETIPKYIPSKLALLRLDTDWYESTKHELNYLYPLLEKNGVLIIDDFGYWEGCKKAVMEYFNSLDKKVLLNRIDSSGRIIIKNF